MGTCYGYSDEEKNEIYWKYINATVETVLLDYDPPTVGLRYLETANPDLLQYIRGLFIAHVTVHAMAASGEPFGGMKTSFQHI